MNEIANCVAVNGVVRENSSQNEKKSENQSQKLKDR